MFGKAYEIIEVALTQIKKYEDITNYNLGENSLNVNMKNGGQIRVPYATLESNTLLESIDSLFGIVED